MMPAQVPTPIAVDLSGLPPELASIEALARLQLGVRRLGGRLELHGASTQLIQMIRFVGLGDVLRVEAEGQAEEREQALGVEEERELDDPPS